MGLPSKMKAADRANLLFRLLAETVVDYAILLLDPHGYVKSWSIGAEKIKGYGQSEILGKHFSVFYTEEDKAARKPEQELQIATAEGRFEDEGWRIRKDGGRFWANVIITAIRDANGQLLGFGKVTRDLTERRNSELALRQANEMLESRVAERTENLMALTGRLTDEIEGKRLTETRLRETTELLEGTFAGIPFPMAIVSPDNRVVMWNRAGEETFGYSPAEMSSHGFNPLTSPKIQLARGAPGQAAPMEPRVLPSQFLHRDGRTLDVRFHIVPLFSEDKLLRAIVILIEDLTEKNQIEAQLRQSQKMEAIGALTGGMAHDFNNLLGVIIGNLDLLQEVRADDATVTEFAGEALDAATRGAELTRSMLAFARRQPLQPVRLELNVLIRSIVKLLSRVLGDDIEIVLELDDDACAVTADPAQLEAALTNLATNARDAMPKGGKLTIATKHRYLDTDYVLGNPDVRPGDYAVIEVSDTGTGITHEVVGKIFEPFFTTKSDRGSGLGLSMVFGFMKQSEGHITVYSEVGHGTIFRLFFPCTQALKEEIAETSAPDASPSEGETILVVEDNAALRRIVVHQLSALGYRVLEAATGGQAIAALETEKIDLLFTDVVMPGGIDGFQLAEIAAIQRPRLKVILTSGFPQTQFPEDQRKRVSYLLTKPYRKEVLARVIRAALEGQDLKRINLDEGYGKDTDRR